MSWTGLANRNIQAAIKMTVIGLLLGAACAPLYIKFLMNTTIPIPFSQVGYAILMIVGLPLLLGQLTRILLIKYVGEQVFTTRVKPLLPACSTWGLMGLIFTAVALKARVFVKAPSLIIQIAVPLVLFYLLTYLVASLIGKYCLPREDGIALVYGTALRSLSIALVLSMTVFGEQGAEIGLLVALAYIIQIQMATWYVRLSKMIFRNNTRSFHERSLHSEEYDGACQ